MPAAALLAGIGAGGVRELFCEYRFFFMKRLVPMLLALVVLGQAVYQQRNFFFKMTPHEATRIIYGINPFVESLEIARFLQQRSLADDKIAILGSEPQICFYAQRRSATAYVYTYEIVKKHKYAPDLQQEMIQQIEAAQPKFLIFVNVVYSWLADPGPYIRDWFMQNRKENYQLVGLIDIFGYPRNSLYLWDQDARDSAPRSNDRVEIYQRVDKL